MEQKPLNWSDCSVEQFMELQELISNKDITPTEFILEVGDVFLDLDEDITDRELRKVKKCISFIAKPISCTLKDEGLKPFNKLSIALFIDLDVILVSNSFVDALPKVAQLLYGLGEDVYDKKITDVYRAVENYTQYRADVFKKYPNLFDSGEEDEEYEEDEEVVKVDPATAWMRTIFVITKGDLTKYSHVMGLPHILVFNWFALSESVKPRSQSVTE